MVREAPFGNGIAHQRFADLWIVGYRSQEDPVDTWSIWESHSAWGFAAP